MQRLLMDRLVEWKDDPDRKPLILQGVKHCGKTYLLKEFGDKYFKSVLYVNFTENRQLADLIGQYTEPGEVIKYLSIYFERDIKPGESLIIFDNVHMCHAALDVLGYFSETAGAYHITAASSYLGVALHKGTSVPPGKVELLTLYPMNFYEFLLAQSPMLAMHLRESGFKGEAYKTFQKQLEDKFLDFQIVGGMPEVVQSWIDTKSIETVDRLQAQIAKSIESDFSGHCPVTMLPKLIALLGAIPSQLVKGNNKFMFSKVKKSWRGKDLDDAIFWLVRAGLVCKVEHIEKPEIPVAANVNTGHFKLYLCDTGLLRQIGHIPPSMLMSGSTADCAVKEAVAQNIVCCELARLYESELYYWSAENPGKAEVDFIVQDGELLIPIEVKACNTGRARSLQQYKMRFAPKKAVLTGPDNGNPDILPLYAFWNLKEWLGK